MKRSFEWKITTKEKIKHPEEMKIIGADSEIVRNKCQEIRKHDNRARTIKSNQIKRRKEIKKTKKTEIVRNFKSKVKNSIQ
jgi:uncharacterized protein YdaT